MRLVQSLLIAPFATMLIGTLPAIAADLGTYRPGTPYHSVVVPGADVCESQCAGDAQCRGWNYVKPAPNSPGVCEFQSSVGAPVSSAISISGVNASNAPRSSRLVSGGTNTVRVGTSVAPKPKAVTQTTLSGRRVVRQAPMPMQPNTHPAMHMRAQTAPRTVQPQAPVMQRRGPARQIAPQRHRAVAPAMPVRPQFRPMLDGGVAPMAPRAPQAALPVQQRAPMMAPQMRPQAPVARPMTQSAAANPVAPMQRPVIRPPAPAAPQALPKRSVANPPSLYGNLHDDVSVPASNAPVPNDPNLPMPLSQSRPVAPVQESGLAGARPR